MSETSRRGFLRQASTVAAGATLLGGISSRAYAAGDETINVGLIGCGGRGRQATEQALGSGGKVRLVAVADAFRDQLDAGLEIIERQIKRNKDTAGSVEVSEDWKFTGFDAYQKVLEVPDLDLVILATPPGFRPIHFEAAVKKGLNVFCEKPVAVDAPGIRRFMEAVKEAKAKNLKIGIGLQRHHQPHYVDIVDRIHNGELGEIMAMRVYWNARGVWDPRRTREQCKTEMEYQMRNWYYYCWLCGDHIVEQHIHNLDVGCWVKGKYPVSANGMGGRQVRTDKRYGEIYDHHAVEYTFDDGTCMFSQCRHIPDTWNAVEEHIHGTKGMAHLQHNWRPSKMEFKDGRTYAHPEPMKGEEIDPYQIEHNDLFRAIRNNISYNEGDYGAKSTMTAILGRMCTYSGRVITWDEALASEISLMPKDFSFDADPPTMPNANGEYPIPVPGKTKVL